MSSFLRQSLSADFLPQGASYRWDPGVLWLNVIADLLIAVCCYAIPVLIFYLGRRRRDLRFNWIFAAFGTFSLACGTAHLIGVVTVWDPLYRLDGWIKAIAAVAALATLFLLVPMMSRLNNLPRPAAMAQINRRLATELVERRAAEESARRQNEELEVRVAERTAELARSEARFRHLADAMPQMVWVTDAAGVMEYCNGRWIDYTRKGLGDGCDGAPIHPDDRERALAGWRESLRTGRPYETEYRLCRHDETYRWFLCRATPVEDTSGEARQWFGTCTDIDEQKRAAETLEAALAGLRTEMERRRLLEEQLIHAQKMEAVGRLAGGVAHDFNNLLTAILGYNEMLRDEVSELPAAAEYADEVRRAAERASALTNQLLAFSRRRVGQPRVVDLNQVVLNLDRMLRRIIGEDIVFETHLAENLHRVNVDPAHIDQVILNLAVNSRDAMPDGGRLTVETANTELDEQYASSHAGVAVGPHVMLAVTDSGFGMDSATRARIFEPFFTTKEQGKGTGLGLSIVYGIVKQNGGEILVYSEPGRGTTFKIYLPAAAGAVEAEESEHAVVSGGATGTILLVEDEDQVRTLARTMLVREGYTVLDAATVDEALQVVREFEGEIHLLLTDVVMPGMSGVELVREVMRDRTATKVLYMSGYTDASIVHQGVLAPGVPFLQKPFTSAALKAKVADALRG